MSELRLLVLRTRLFEDHRTAPAIRSLPERFRSTEFVIDGDVGAMSTADWDRVLEAVLDNDRCITL